MNKIGNAIEFCTSMRKVLNTLAEIVTEKKSDDKGRQFLNSFFGSDKDLFCRFIGFARMEMKTNPQYKKKRIVVDIWAEITMTGISMGWLGGYYDAKRIYSAA